MPLHTAIHNYSQQRYTQTGEKYEARFNNFSKPSQDISLRLPKDSKKLWSCRLIEAIFFGATMHYYNFYHYFCMQNNLIHNKIYKL